MSGLEVIAAVTGIISAFTASVKMFQDWREKKKQRKRDSQNAELALSLASGGRAVQQEYDQHFARLGRRFAMGDGI